jgi:transcriptional regulator with XRE-family HTH domain
MPKKFGTYIRRLRNEKGLTIRQLEKIVRSIKCLYFSNGDWKKRNSNTRCT